MREPDEAKFLKDVAAHEMKVLKDDGAYRHLSFRKPGTYCMGFDLITWPGYLAYTGDMGCYVFTRIEDMFEFFRTDRKRVKEGKTLYINLSYWGEKCASRDRDGIKEYSADTFRAEIQRWLDEEEASDEVREEVKGAVLSRADDGEYAAHEAARDFEHDGFRFSDFWERDLTEYTYRFIWCCYALAWGIRKYDESRAPKPQSNEKD